MRPAGTNLRGDWGDDAKEREDRHPRGLLSRSRWSDDAAISAVFLSGRAFPAFEERTLQVGGALLWKVVAELAQASDGELRAAYRKYGDLGSAAFELLERQPSEATGVTLAEVRVPSTTLPPAAVLPPRKRC